MSDWKTGRSRPFSALIDTDEVAALKASIVKAVGLFGLVVGRLKLEVLDEGFQSRDAQII